MTGLSTYYPSGVNEIQPYMRERRLKMGDDEALDFLNQKRSYGERGHDPLHLAMQKQWFINLAHFMGLQRFEPTGLFEDVDPNFALVSSDYNANHLFRIVMAQVSRLSRARPEAEVIANTPDIDDQEGAKVGQQFLDFYDDKFNLRRLRRSLAFWVVTCGTGFIRADWNQRGGTKTETFKNPNDGSILPADQLNDEDKKWLRKAGGVDAEQEGQLELEVVSPFQVSHVPVFRDMKDLPWMIIEFERSIDWIWDNYPDKAKDIEPEDYDVATEGYYERRLHTLVNRHGFSLAATAGETNESVRVIEAWKPPSKQYPEGFKIVGTRQRLLDNGPHPYAAAGLDLNLYPSLRFPVSRHIYSEMPGRAWGLSLVEHLIGPQRDYNRGRTQLVQQRDIMSTAQWLSPYRAKLGQTRNEYGDIWQYDSSGGKPELVQPPGLSQVLVASLERSVYDMQMISAQSDASQAQVPQGVRSGVALRSLQEADEMTLGPAIEDMEDGWSDTNTRMLALTWKFMKSETAIPIYGESRQSDLAFFKGINLNGNFNVRIRAGSMRPRSQAMQMQTMLDLIEVGALNPADPDQAEKVMEVMDVGNMKKFFEHRNLDRRRANIENQMFNKPNPEPGQQPVFPAVEDYDDHQIHMDEHVKFMKTDSYELLPLARKLAFQAHIKGHGDAIAELAQAAMVLQQGAGAGGPGGGSPPAEKGEASSPANKNPTPGTEGASPQP